MTVSLVCSPLGHCWHFLPEEMSYKLWIIQWQRRAVLSQDNCWVVPPFPYLLELPGGKRTTLKNKTLLPSPPPPKKVSAPLTGCESLGTLLAFSGLSFLHGRVEVVVPVVHSFPEDL